MALYNIVRGQMTCPRCGQQTTLEVETQMGDMSQVDALQVGDSYPWINDAPVNEGGRPAGGEAIGDGYSVCPLCSKDFFVNVVVESDVIQRLEVDESREGFIP